MPAQPTQTQSVHYTHPDQPVGPWGLGNEDCWVIAAHYRSIFGSIKKELIRGDNWQRQCDWGWCISARANNSQCRCQVTSAAALLLLTTHCFTTGLLSGRLDSWGYLRSKEGGGEISRGVNTCVKKHLVNGERGECDLVGVSSRNEF